MTQVSETLRTLSGGEGGITRRCAPLPFGAALAGVIPASWLSRSIDPDRAELMSRMAERVGFEPTQTQIEISKLLKNLRLVRPLETPSLPAFGSRFGSRAVRAPSPQPFHRFLRLLSAVEHAKHDARLAVDLVIHGVGKASGEQADGSRIPSCECRRRAPGSRYRQRARRENNRRGFFSAEHRIAARGRDPRAPSAGS